MAWNELTRVKHYDVVRVEHLNQYADAVEDLRRELDTRAGQGAARMLALGLMASGSTSRPMSRRSLLGLRWFGK